MQIDSEFLFQEIEKLEIEAWIKEGLKTLVTAELSGKSAAQFREILESQANSQKGEI
jgi:hypothetical protein